jgi:type I restriction enzyme M protein
VTDPETGELIDDVDDQLLRDMLALKAGQTTETLSFIDSSLVSMRYAVPTYYDRRFDDNFKNALKSDPIFNGFSSLTIGQMVERNLLSVRNGHGSPSQEQRVGEIPYIKVSDLRAGMVNINPTNRVPTSIARKFWRGESSGLSAFDLMCPERTSKNIGDFCVLMPGQENVLLTKEIIVVRPGLEANFDAFYVLWAFTLKIVRDQWKRIVFMQTNREDVGKRYHEILIPIPPGTATAIKVSEEFRNYYLALAKARESMTTYLAATQRHHYFMDGGTSEGEVDDFDKDNVAKSTDVIA